MIFDKFLTFFQEDIGFNGFPPLTDVFGEINLSKSHQILLYQQMNGITTEQPLLASFNENNQKWAVLFGEGLWKWRAASFLETNEFKDFDTFIGNFVQYLASKKTRKRLEVNTENLYPSNATVLINAFYVDENYQFDTRVSLWLHLEHQTTKKTTLKTMNKRNSALSSTARPTAGLNSFTAPRINSSSRATDSKSTAKNFTLCDAPYLLHK